jgi:chorismate synthase
MVLRFFSTGESHGPELNVFLEGIPANLDLLKEDVDEDLKRRQSGYGRGARMKIETDRVIFTAGVRHGRTFGGSPIGMKIINKDYEKWLNVMSSAPVKEDDLEIKAQLDEKFISKVRPGHADLAGALKYNTQDVRDILERSSARETTSRVAAGAVCKKFLANFGIEIFSHVIRIGKIQTNSGLDPSYLPEEEFISFREKVEDSEFRIYDLKGDLESQLKIYVDETRKQGDTLGGSIEVFAKGLPLGLGSHVQWDRRLDGLLAQALMSVHTVKAVEFGIGHEVGLKLGSQVQDQIYLKEANESQQSLRYRRSTNNLGGIEAGISNGEPIVSRVSVKPIPTLISKLDSIDLETKAPAKSHFERSDICVVPAAGVVLEAMMAICLTSVFLEKFGGDSMEETRSNFHNFSEMLRSR